MAKSLQSQQLPDPYEPTNNEDNARLQRKIDICEEDIKELKTRVQQYNIDEKGYKKAISEYEVTIKKLQQEKSKEKNKTVLDKKTTRAIAKSVLECSDEYRPRQYETEKPKLVETSITTEKIVTQLKSEIMEKDLLIRKLNEQLIIKESKLNNEEVKSKQLEEQIKEAPPMSKILQLETLCKNYKESNESLKRRLALHDVKEDVQIPHSTRNMLAKSTNLKSSDLSYPHSLKLLEDLCGVMEISSPYELIAAVTKYKKLLDLIPRMEKFIKEVCTALRIDDIEKVLPELSKLQASNPNFRYKVCKQLFSKDYNKVTDTEIFERIGELQSNERLIGKKNTIESHKLDVLA